VFIVDNILLSPMKGFMWIVRELHNAAQQEIKDEGDQLTHRLSTLYMMLETSQLTQDEFDQQEQEILTRLDEIEAAQGEPQAADDDDGEDSDDDDDSDDDSDSDDSDDDDEDQTDGDDVDSSVDSSVDPSDDPGVDLNESEADTGANDHPPEGEHLADPESNAQSTDTRLSTPTHRADDHHPDDVTA